MARYNLRLKITTKDGLYNAGAGVRELHDTLKAADVLYPVKDEVFGDEKTEVCIFIEDVDTGFFIPYFPEPTATFEFYEDMFSKFGMPHIKGSEVIGK